MTGIGVKAQPLMPVDFSFLNAAVDPDHGFDVVIVVVSHLRAQQFWQRRLRASRAAVIGQAELVVVHERWNGRPGNGLGTLNALVQANVELAESGPDLWARLGRGESVGVWHTAGHGKRLYPLPLAHLGDKSRTWLPGQVDCDGTPAPIRLLEAVLRQTSPFASQGGVWVFWGDQLVLPSAPVHVPPTDVALLGCGGLTPSAAVWEQRSLHQYGIVASRADGTACQLEKLRWEAFQAVLPQLGPVSSVATSLGSFRMTVAVARALCEGYAAELSTRTGLVDTDPGWWMPMTLPDAVARAAVGDAAVDRFLQVGIDARLGLVDLGADASWWDFGTLPAWVDSCRAVLTDASLRRLLCSPEPDRGSIGVLSDAKLEPGAVVVGCDSPDLSVTGGVAMGCNNASGHVHGVAYQLSDVRIDVASGAVACTDGEDDIVTAPIHHDGKAMWNEVLPGNSASWSSLADRA